MSINNDEIKNENESETINLIKNNRICEICQNEEAEYECKECPTFKILCQNCDLYIHSMKIRINHKREKIIQNEQNKFISNDKEEKIDNLENCLKKDINPITKNYLEQVRAIYEENKSLALDENFSLEQKISSNKNLYKHKIDTLKNKLNELQIKNQNNLKVMKDSHNIDLKQLISEKDYEINYYINNNKELEKTNFELKTKLETKMGEYIENQNKYNDVLTGLKFNLENLQKENIDLKEFYENKINFIIDSFNLEKKKLINSYELDIKEMNNEYNLSKEKYINYLGKRNNDIENSVRENNDEINKLREKIKDLGEKVNELKIRKEELIKVNNELKFENDSLKENFERMRKELKFETKRKEIEKKRANETQNNFYKAKKENIRISKIARPKRSQSVKY